MGAMIPSVIKASISLKFKMSDVKLNIQDTLNQIMPMMIPAILVGIVCYYRDYYIVDCLEVV